MLVLLLCEPKLARRLGAIRTEKVNGIYNIPVSDCILVSCDDEIWLLAARRTAALAEDQLRFHTMCKRLIAAALLWAAMVSCALAQTSGFNPSYPPRASAVTAVNSAADTTTLAAALPAATGQWTYICGFTVSGLGATTGVGTPVTVATLVGGNTATYEYSFVTGATLANPVLSINYTPCIPASAINAAITVTVTGAAGNTATNIVVQGYQFPNP